MFITKWCDVAVVGGMAYFSNNIVSLNCAAHVAKFAVTRCHALGKKGSVR